MITNNMKHCWLCGIMHSTLLHITFWRSPRKVCINCIEQFRPNLVRGN